MNSMSLLKTHGKKSWSFVKTNQEKQDKLEHASVMIKTAAHLDLQAHQETQEPMVNPEMLVNQEPKVIQELALPNTLHQRPDAAHAHLVRKDPQALQDQLDQLARKAVLETKAPTARTVVSVLLELLELLVNRELREKTGQKEPQAETAKLDPKEKQAAKDPPEDQDRKDQQETQEPTASQELKEPPDLQDQQAVRVKVRPTAAQAVRANQACQAKTPNIVHAREDPNWPRKPKLKIFISNAANFFRLHLCKLQLSK